MAEARRRGPRHRPRSADRRAEAAQSDRSDDASPRGSSYVAGWYGYVDKDLRTLLGAAVARPVLDPLLRRRRRRGVRAGALADPRRPDELAAAQGRPPRGAPTRRRSGSGSAGLLADTMRWTNRPTFQQVIVFRIHR